MDDATKELRKILKCNAIVSVSESIINTPVLRASIADKLLDNVEKLVIEWHTQQLNTAEVEARIDERQSMSFHRAYGKDYQYTLEILEEQNDARIATLKQQLKDGK